MSYAAGELAALTLIRTLTAYTFNDKNSLSTANDSSNVGANLINNGKAYYYCFLEVDESVRERTGIGQTRVETEWQTMIRLICFANPKTKESPIKLLAGIREALIAKLDAYMELDTLTTAYAMITDAGKVERFTTNEGGTPFVMQEMILTWTEVTDITQLD